MSAPKYRAKNHAPVTPPAAVAVPSVELNFALMAMDAGHAENEFKRAFTMPNGIEREIALTEVRHRCKRIADALRFIGANMPGLLKPQAG